MCACAAALRRFSCITIPDGKVFSFFMNRIAGFLTDRRRLLLIVTLALAVVCGVLSAFVPINKDRTKYLSDSSEMKQGLAVMRAAFPEAEEKATIRVMFDGLDDAQKQTVKTQLRAIPGVSSVQYDASGTYNQDDHTLYVVNSRYDYGTDEERAVEAAIADGFSEYRMQYRNNDIQSTQVPLWLIASAMGIAIAVLLAMSNSWLEPALLLFTIGIAVVLNLGTNIVLPYTDELTISVGPVIQFVLSMDYSIILLNRYHMEKGRQPDKTQAMKTALAGAIPSVASSSFTTAVGLLALVFLSFKLGPELGIVLAKGVLISMICVLTVLPALILLFDRAIEKTKKKALHIPMGAFAKYSLKMRYIMPVLFVALFVAFFFFQSRTAITFTEKSEDPLADVFPKENTVVLVYDNEEEDKIDAFIEKAQEDAHVSGITGYTNTLGKSFTPAEMYDAIESFGGAAGLSENTIRLIYALSQGETAKEIAAGDFLRFLSDEVLTDETFSAFLSDADRENADYLRLLSDKELLVRETDAQTMADIFGIDAADVSSLYLYHRMQTGVRDSGVMTLPEFADFVLNTVAADKTYGKMIDADTLASVKQLALFTDSEAVSAKHTSSELAEMLGMEESALNAVFTLYRLEHPGSREMSLREMTDYLLSKPALRGRMDEQQLGQLTLLQSVMDAADKQTAFTSAELAALLGADDAQTEQLYILRMSKTKPNSVGKLSPQTFISFAVSDVLTNETFRAFVGEADADRLKAADALIAAVVSEKTYTASGMYALLSGVTDELSQDMVELLYVYYGAMTAQEPGPGMTIPAFFSFVSEDILADPRFAAFLDEETAAAVGDGEAQLQNGIAQLRSEKYSRLIVTSDYPDESAETLAFIDRLNTLRRADLRESYLIGNSVMVSEMHETFQKEYFMISLITAVAIFLVVLSAFRTPMIPLLLTLVVQCGVYMTVTVIGLYSGSIYYLALLIVQSILMGAAIDYGIVFCNFFRSARKETGLYESLKTAYEGSIHTILTSGLILIVVLTSIGSFVPSDMISEVCITLAIGTLIAILLILFVLPGMAACFDKRVTKERTKKPKAPKT